MSNESMKVGMKDNRKCLMKIFETLQFLGRQRLALRGEENYENSNFIQLLKLRRKDLVKLNQWLEKKTDKYTSHDIKNELLTLMANQILSSMAD